MTEFDAEKFDEKYTHYFNELQQAYRNAFETLNEAHDSELVHAIDQQILDESEPVYDGDGEFTVVLPDDPLGRLAGVSVERDQAAELLDVYVAEIESQLQSVFEFDGE